MVDIDLFITALFFLVDNFCEQNLIPPKPGPNPSLNASEAITLLIFSQWARFRSEQDFYPFADRKLRSAFPDLPSYLQLNRQWRALHDQTCAFFIHLAESLDAQKAFYEAMDTATVWVGMKASRLCWQSLPKALSLELTANVQDRASLFPLTIS